MGEAGNGQINTRKVSEQNLDMERKKENKRLEEKERLRKIERKTKRNRYKEGQEKKETL